jgi:hypothetical protein
MAFQEEFNGYWQWKPSILKVGKIAVKKEGYSIAKDGFKRAQLA